MGICESLTPAPRKSPTESCDYLDAYRIRFAPPLVISRGDLAEAVKIIGECLADFDTVENIPGDEGSEKGH